jgi:SAM-dependent methyltransferase
VTAAAPKEKWLTGIDDEIAFWQQWADTRGGQWPQDYANRIDPGFPLQPHIARWLDPSAARVRILDVGAGPATYVGRRWEGHEVELVAVDALAERYDAALRFRDALPVRTLQCETERLTERFPEGSFDFVNARNTLDHSYDPLECIRQMLRVARPGGHVGLWHFADEAEREAYAGLHQWNFSVQGGDMAIWNRAERHSLRELARGLGTIVDIPADGAWEVNVVLRRD